VKFCQLIVRLFVVVQPQLHLTKLKLKYLKSGIKCKKERKKNTSEKVFSLFELDFFQVQLKFAFRIRPLV